VRNAILPWIAKGYLREEKADQHFDAVAKFRRARKVFQPEEPTHTGRERQSL
jgi:agmatine/peptidylarginine deiminase